uniref:Secreted protein n=1 Tax=Steinernema glaseri TaxID=37863 RepID=A0A1I8ARA5_9BILA
MTKMTQTVVILAACFSLGLAYMKFENASSGVVVNSYYHDETWNLCFAYRFTKKEGDELPVYTSRTECEEDNAYEDMGPCYGPDDNTERGRCWRDEDEEYYEDEVLSLFVYSRITVPKH